MKSWKMGAAIAAAALLLAALPSFASGGEEWGPPELVFSGDADTLSNKSRWFDVRGAHRIAVRMYSTRAAVGAYAATDLDSLYSDSLGSFFVLTSDSLGFIARDSAGTVVTFRSAIAKTSAHGPSYPMAADSSRFDASNYISGQTAVVDTTYKLVMVANTPTRKPLRAPANGSGLYTTISATAPGSIGTYGDGALYPKYMRLEFAAFRRNTINTWNSTTANVVRVRAVKNLRVEIIRIYRNK